MLTAIYGTTVVGVDTEYHLLWGEQLVSGRGMDLDSLLAPTAHPLAVLVGAGAALLGEWSGAAMAVFSYLTYVLAGAAVWRLGAMAFDRSVATAALLIFVASAGTMRSALVSPNDMLYLAALLHALRAGIPNPRVGGAVLWPLAIAGLLRPEAWVLAGAYLVFLWLDPARRRPAHVLVVAGPISMWVLLGLVGAGDPLFALTGTHRLRELADRPTGLFDSVAALPRLVDEVLPAAAALTGVLGIRLAFRARRPAAGWLLFAAAGCLALFFALMAAGFSMTSRYLLPTLGILTVFAGATLVDWRHIQPGFARRAWALASATCLFFVGTAVVYQVDEHSDLHSWAQSEGKAWNDLEALLTANGDAADCGALTITGPLSWHGHTARLLDVRADSLRDSMLHEPVYGLHVLPVSQSNLLALTAAAPWAPREPKVPDGATRVGGNASWSAWRLCPTSSL